ncbi:complex I NDUFA9 subunit family protein [Hyphomicrobium sp.]|jgi:NADH dehydrogenase|uniref:complex I NDUFA9 subunit family protein n=1 Tax=Hyphomicrobium sp. TaxID=82 RepID=UPI002D17A10B|nr:complex I NDUFA9 subunit family protein [Hyphomicrobium sp.]HVZ05760.1 complex I NDUFA9 subunit family protein [Hyphomicrobium sp.]
MARNGKLATVFGGSGFIGRQIVWFLARRDYRVRAAVRRPDLAGYLQPMGVVGQIHAVQANLRFANSVVRAVEAAETVINAVGILAPEGAQTFEAVHIEGARQVAKAAREAGAKRLVHISAIGADSKSPSKYARTKAAGEAAVLDEFPSAIILRPSIVFGPEDDFFNRFAALARVSPVLPLIGGGKTKFQPVFAGDVGEAAANAAIDAGVPGTVYEIGGPEIVTFRDILEATLRYADRRRLLLPVPFWLMQIQAILSSPLPNSMRPITVDQLRLLKLDNVVSDAAKREGRTLAALGIPQPAAIDAIVPEYLERFKPKGQYASYRI